MDAKEDILEQFTGCGPTSALVAAYQQKVQESSVQSTVSQVYIWISQLVFSIPQNPKVGSNARKGMDLPVRVRANGQRTTASFLHVLSIGCQQVWSRLKVDFPT